MGDPHGGSLHLAFGKTALFSPANIGTWFCIEVHMKLNSRDAEDGVFEYWMDGRLEAQRTNVNWIGSRGWVRCSIGWMYGINAAIMRTSMPSTVLDLGPVQQGATTLFRQLRGFHGAYRMCPLNGTTGLLRPMIGKVNRFLICRDSRLV